MADQIKLPTDINIEDLLDPLGPSILDLHQAVPNDNNDEDLDDEWVLLDPMPMPIESLEKELKNCSIEDNKEIIQEDGRTEQEYDSDYIIADNPNTTTDQLCKDSSDVNSTANQRTSMEPLEKEKVDSVSKKNSASPSQETEESNYGDKEDPNPSNVMKLNDWLPSHPIFKEFPAIMTYIDDDGFIYLHNCYQWYTRDCIRESLFVQFYVNFKGRDPKTKFQKWSVGEPCIVKYSTGMRCYRGRVIEVDKENSKCLIQYIDFGYEDRCSFKELRKSLPLQDIPAQAIKCKLNRIQPIGEQWDINTLAYIYFTYVEKKCFVKVVGDVVNGITPIELHYKNVCINDELVDFQMAKYKDDTKAPVMKNCPLEKNKEIIQENSNESNSEPDYIVVDDSNTANDQLYSREDSAINGKFLTYPKHGYGEYMCKITEINDINALELNIVWDEYTFRLYEQMFEELQSESMNMLPLNGILENKACIAIYPEDGRWYRASILQFNEITSRVKVRYVDYGKDEIISLADTREICYKWVKLPPATISAKLFGVRLNPDTDIGFITIKYAKVFLDKGLFQMNILGYVDQVPLVELRNENSELIYMDLIKCKILIKCD